LPKLAAAYGNLPPQEAGQRSYGVTPSPAEKMIPFHSESSQLTGRTFDQAHEIVRDALAKVPTGRGLILVRAERVRRRATRTSVPFMDLGRQHAPLKG